MRILPLTLLVCSVILSDGTMAGMRLADPEIPERIADTKYSGRYP